MTKSSGPPPKKRARRAGGERRGVRRAFSQPGAGDAPARPEPYRPGMCRSPRSEGARRKMGTVLPGPSASPVSVAFIGVAPMVAAALFFVWTRITTVQLGYVLSEAAASHQRLLEDNRVLRLEVAALRATARLERLAKEVYGLRPPGPDQVVVLAEGRR